MPAPTNPTAMRRLAASIRARHGESPLANELELEAARLILAERGPAPITLPTDGRPFTALYERLCELWGSEGIASPTPIRPLYDIALSAGIVDRICPGEVEGPRRLTMFSKWFSAFPHPRRSRNGRLWHERPTTPTSSMSVLLPALIHPDVMGAISRSARANNETREATITMIVASYWDIDITSK
jgi:hypothetical protein